MALENFLSDARSVVTLVSFLTFMGILWWAFSARRTEDFKAASMLPFDDEEIMQQGEGSHV